MSDLTLKANEEGFVVCPVCGKELRGSGIEYFSGATIVANPEAIEGWDYTTESTCAEGSDLEEIHCSACSWSLELYKNVSVKVSK